MTKLTYEDFTRAFAKALEERGPDFIYGAQDAGGECTYSKPDGSPDCLLGYALFELDPDAYRNLTRNEWRDDELGQRACSPGSIRAVIFNYNLDVSWALSDSLFVAQNAQDAGVPLARVVDQFHDAYKARTS